MICAACGATNPPDNRFCGQCGTALAAPDATAVVERRLVSVLFADLVAFTTYAEAHDAEDVMDMQSRYFEMATTIVIRHGGTVEKFIGDAVVAFWGTPTAREDDAERAVRAALELVAAVPGLGGGLEARGGVLTGEAAVTIGAANKGMVTGDIVNIAARLQTAAAPSTVLVGEATHRAASGAVAFEPAGAQELKGKAEPVLTWRALHVVAERGGRGRIEGLDAPFFGRDVELRQLKELFHATGAERRIRHVAVVGSAGTGKSRLTWELEKYLDGVEEPVWWHRGRSPAYGEGVTFWALGEMVRERAGLAEGDDEAASRDRIAALLDAQMPGRPERLRVEAALLQLLGVASGLPPDELFSAWRGLFEAMAATGTVVLVFEDLHWADAGTLDFVDHLVEWSRELPIFVLTVGRPELLGDRPAWGSGRRGVTSLVVEPLPTPAMRALLRGLVPRLPDPTAEAIVARAEGVPLYAMESVRMLLAEGRLRLADGVLEPAGDLGELAKLAIPETLTALVAARLDSLLPLDRALLLDAAVLGQSFAPAGLAAVSGRAETDLEQPLQTLVRRELLRQVADPRSPERGRYVFVQALVREIAYGTLTKRDRISRHLAAARWLQALGDPELAAAVAGHLVAARNLFAAGAEADALGTEAAIALRAAGDRAAVLAVPSQALELYEQAAAFAAQPGEQAELLELAGANALAIAAFDAADGFATRAAELWRSLGDRPGTARATALRAKGILQLRRYEQARQLLDSAIAEFSDLAGDPAYRRLQNQQARLLFLSGDLESAVRLGRPLIEEAAAAEDVEVLGDALITLGSTLDILEQYDEGRAMLQRAREIAEAHGLNSLLTRAINNSLITLMEEDPASAWDVGLQGLAVATRLGQRDMVHSVGGNLGFIGIWTGDWDEAHRLAVNALEDTVEPDDRIGALGAFSALQLLRGRPCEAEIAELVACTDPLPDRQKQLYRDDVLGYVDLVEGRLDHALARWRPIAADQSAAGLVALVAHLEIWRRNPDGAEQILRAAARNLPDAAAGAVVRRGLAAGIAGLRGDLTAALAGYRGLAGDLPAWRVPVHEILFAIDMATVIGPSEPFVAAEIARARQTIERLDSPPLAKLLDAAVAGELSPARH